MFDDPEAGRAINRYHGLTLREIATDAGVEGRAPADAHVLDDAGRARSGILAGMMDSAGGLCGGLAALPRWVVSTNLVARIVPSPLAGPIRLHAHVVRAGRNAVVTAIHGFDDGTGTQVCEAVLTAAALEPAGGPPSHPRPLHVPVPPREDSPPKPEVFYGIRPRRTGDTGGVELDLVPTVRNPWGILHGGVTTSLVEAAVDAAMGRPAPITSEVLRFLAPGRVGPVGARADAVGVRPDGVLLRVEVRDHGADDRLLALVVVTARPDPNG